MTSSAEDLHRWSLLAGSDESDDLIRSARAHFAAAEPRLAFRAALTNGTEPSQHQRWIDAGYADIGLPEHLDGVGGLVDLALLLDAAAAELLGDGLLATCAARQSQARVGFVAPGRGALARCVGSVRDGQVSVTDAVVVDGRNADRLTLLVQDVESSHVVVVDPEAVGVTAVPVARDHDPTRPAITVRLADAIPESLVEVATGRVDAVLSGSRICVAADLVGTASAALDLALGHVRTREQFGRPIGAFQAVKHQLADAYVQIESARSLVLGAAIDGETDDGARLSLLALGAAGDAARRASALAVQLMGAMGVTFEADAHLALRRVQQGVLVLESTRAAYERAARLTLEGRHA